MLSTRAGFLDTLDHAAELMQRVLTDQTLGQEIGGRAREEIRRNFSPEAAERLMAERLDLKARESVDTEDGLSQTLYQDAGKGADTLRQILRSPHADPPLRKGTPD